MQHHHRDRVIAVAAKDSAILLHHPRRQLPQAAVVNGPVEVPAAVAVVVIAAVAVGGRAAEAAGGRSDSANSSQGSFQTSV